MRKNARKESAKPSENVRVHGGWRGSSSEECNVSVKHSKDRNNLIARMRNAWHEKRNVTKRKKGVPQRNGAVWRKRHDELKRIGNDADVSAIENVSKPRRTLLREPLEIRSGRNKEARTETEVDGLSQEQVHQEVETMTTTNRTIQIETGEDATEIDSRGMLRDVEQLGQAMEVIHRVCDRMDLE
jgi:hypothetical protein